MIRQSAYGTHDGTVEERRLARVVGQEGGTAVLDVRAMFDAGEGALVSATSTGVGDLGADGYERFLRGDVPPKVVLRVALRFLTAAPELQWLNRLQCLGVGEFDGQNSRVAYDVYAVR